MEAMGEWMLFSGYRVGRVVDIDRVDRVVDIDRVDRVMGVE